MPFVYKKEKNSALSNQITKASHREAFVVAVSFWLRQYRLFCFILRVGVAAADTARDASAHRVKALCQRRLHLSGSRPSLRSRREAQQGLSFAHPQSCRARTELS